MSRARRSTRLTGGKTKYTNDPFEAAGVSDESDNGSKVPKGRKEQASDESSDEEFQANDEQEEEEDDEEGSEEDVAGENDGEEADEEEYTSDRGRGAQKTVVSRPRHQKKRLGNDLAMLSKDEMHSRGTHSSMVLQSLDTLLERYLHLLDRHQKLQAELATTLSSGFLSLAQANYTCPPGRRYGADYYDERMKATRKVDLEPPTSTKNVEASSVDESSDESTKRGDYKRIFTIKPATSDSAEEPSELTKGENQSHSSDAFTSECEVPEECDPKEGIDEGQRTPRGVSSAAPSSPVGSLTADSLTGQSLQPSPPMHPNSLLTNPWADAHESAIETPKSEPQIPQIDRPVTPEQSRPTTSGSPVLLRFPPAPGIEDNNLKVPAASGTETASPGIRSSTVPQTPPARRLRNSISSRFSPGPLLPTISAGFSAVVAESLRRGETSPVKDRKSVRRHRGKQLSTTIVDGFLRSRDGENANIDEGLGPRGVLPTARFNSTGDIATAPVTAGQSTTTLDTEDAPQNLQPDGSTSVSRIRSLSDSWSGGLAWLGGTLRKVNGHGNGHEQIAESQTNEEETGANTQA